MSDNQDYNDEQLSQDQSQQMNGKNNSNSRQDQQNYDDEVSDCFSVVNCSENSFLSCQKSIKE